MSLLTWSLVFALLSNLAFSSASLVYTTYSQKFSSLWMNTVKTGVAFLATLVVVPLWWPLTGVPLEVVLWLMVSGFVGLMLGDWFLLRAFASLGASPALMLFAFQPLMLAAWERELFDYALSGVQLAAMGCLVGCVFLFSRDQKKRTDSWNFFGFALGLAAVILDALGIVISKWAFEIEPDLAPGESHLYRCFGALVGFALAWKLTPQGMGFKKPFQILSRRSLRWVLVASLLGTFVSLLFYLWALKLGEMSLVSSVAVTGPLFAAALEHTLRRQWPTVYMWWATALFVLGFSLLVLFPNS